MYQEWESPSFTIEQLTELCREFFRSKEFAAFVDRKSERKAIVLAENRPLGISHTLTIEQKGSKLRLTFPPVSRSTMGLAAFGSVLVSGLGLRHEADKQRVLDRIEEQFWEHIDRSLAQPKPEAVHYENDGR